MKTTQLLFHAFLFFILSSCGPTLYIPNTINTPMLAGKGDWKASAGAVGFGPEGNIEFQGSYALTNNLAVMADIFHGNDSDVKHFLGEGGLGIFHTFLPTQKGYNAGRVEMFGGIGFGEGQDDDVTTSFVFQGQNRLIDYEANYQRWFLQPGIGLRTRFIDVAFHTRLAYVNFSKIMEYEDGVLQNQRQLNFSTIEPVVTISFGYKYVKYYMQFGSVNPIGGEEAYEQVTDPILGASHVNVGLAFNPWKENPVETPPIALQPEPKEEPVPTPTDTLTSNGSEITKIERRSMPSVLPVGTSNLTICLRDGGSPDGDIVSVSFNGAWVMENVELFKQETCVDVQAQSGEENILQIHAISDGEFKPNTIQVIIKEAKSERTFYVRTEAGKAEEFILSFD